jgi:hypothetical protein
VLLGRLLQDYVLVQPQGPRHLYGDGDAEGGGRHDDIGLEGRELRGELDPDVRAERDAVVNDHEQRDGEVGVEGDEGERERSAGDGDLVGLAGSRVHCTAKGMKELIRRFKMIV